MTDGGGGFYATQDADSEGEEGKFFVWTPEEVAEAVGGDRELARLAMDRFGVTNQGNFEGSGRSVLFEAKSIAELAVQRQRPPSEIAADLDRAMRAMLSVRARRERPFRDEKILASWNGLMIGAMVEASQVLGEPEFLHAAEKAYAFADRVLVHDGRVQRHAIGSVVKGPGFLDDHAFLASAAIDLYEATGDPAYIAKARAIADRILELFWDKEGAGFFFSPEGGERLIVRTKDPFDQAIPSGSSIACLALLRLSALVDEKYGEPAAKALERAAGAAVLNPFGFGQTLCALDRLVRGSVDVVVVGAREDARTRTLAATVFRSYAPNRTLAWLDAEDARSREACAVLAEGKAAGNEPVAYVCRGRTCSLPVALPDALAKMLRE
jgi:uncharacterized protein YyaL (SSP411 family)